MSYFDDASLVMIPSGYKTSKVYSVKPTSGDGDLTFTRSNDTATRVGPDGLIEKVRTNLALQSQTFDNASWVKVSATITANATTAPDGTLTADKLIANSGYDPASPTGNLTQTNVVASNTHTISLYAKAAEFTSIRFRENLVVGSFLTIDLTNGSITGGGSQYINPTATAVGDGWYRISFVTPATADLGKYSIRVANTGDGTSGVFIWGFQFEVSDFGPTPYIATTTAAVSVGPVANVPRLDYLGSSCPRLLLEPQRTNLITFSEYFGASYWTKTNATITDNATTSPEGVANADAFTENSGTSTHFMRSEEITASASTYYSASFFVKYNGRHFQVVGSTGSEGGGYVNFDLINGEVGDSDQITGTIEAYSNGWYRCTATNITTSSATEIRLIPYLCTSPTSARAESYTGDGTSGVYIYGAQIEAGSYATSLIPSYGAAVTRGADSASKTGIASLIGQSEGTIYFEGTIEGVGATTRRLISLSDGGNNNMLQVYNASNTNSLELVVTTAGATQAVITASSAITFGQAFKFAFAYANNDFVFYVNGVQIGIDGSGSVPATSVVQFARGDGNNTHEGTNSQLLLFKTRLSNSDLAALTA